MRTAVSFPGSLKDVLGERPQTYLENTQEKLASSAGSVHNNSASCLSSENAPSFFWLESSKAPSSGRLFQRIKIRLKKASRLHETVTRVALRKEALAERLQRQYQVFRLLNGPPLGCRGGNNWKMTNGILKPCRLIVARCRPCEVTAALTHCRWSECCQNRT